MENQTKRIGHSLTNLTIGFLLVNRIKHLPGIAINSVLINSQANIIIGYVNEFDIRDLPIDHRITYVKLNETESGIKSYFSYESQEFFEIVKLKWQLLSMLQERAVTGFICYLDLDVVLLKDFEETISQFFSKNPRKQLLVQDDSVRPDFPHLCMGMLAFRNSPAAGQIFACCSTMHTDKSKSENRVGDDEIITNYYNARPEEISLLPQSTFPTGRLLNTFIHRQNFVGIATAGPYIFHANYLVGTRKKSLVLLKIAVREGLKPRYLGIGFLDHQKIRVEYTLRSIYRNLNAIIFDPTKRVLRTFKSIHG